MLRRGSPHGPDEAQDGEAGEGEEEGGDADGDDDEVEDVPRVLRRRSLARRIETSWAALSFPRSGRMELCVCVCERSGVWARATSAHACMFSLSDSA